MKTTLLLLPFIVMMAACQKETESVTMAETPPELSAVFQSVADAETGSIPELRTQVQPGDEVVFVAKIMGSETPFVNGRALMVVGDEQAITSCDLMDEEGHCETPWDACCETREGLLSGTATVQVMDAGGNVLANDLRGVNGLKELSRVKVKGVVAPLSTEQALVVNASKIEVLE
ncbi:hypothetical protein P0Y35_07560 [Kiritimatiellaeota bacterium B1221]|nr:hypothetical protein [Kiritimatiellaeota bacterium B1221]